MGICLKVPLYIYIYTYVWLGPENGTHNCTRAYAYLAICHGVRNRTGNSAQQIWRIRRLIENTPYKDPPSPRAHSFYPSSISRSNHPIIRIKALLYLLCQVGVASRFMKSGPQKRVFRTAKKKQCGLHTGLQPYWLAFGCLP